ncbi:MAG: DUF1559 domain-containing protein [Thermoguttaceae bacterium]|nr:DUF1559 domain-containing protein [Thermoguttaceae bacterium]
MKHTAPPEGVLLLKRKGHKQHHRKKNHHFSLWFWSLLLLAVVCGSGYLGMEYYLKQTSTLRMREEVKSSMEAIVNALEEYHRANNAYPPPFSTDKAGEPLLSWRVLILPYFLDDNRNPKYQDLYDSFDQGQPWNGSNNIGLLAKMPHEYRSPMSQHSINDENANYLTNYLAIVGKDTVFPGNREEVSKSRITDRLEDTVAVIETADEKAVFWTKPDDFEFNPLDPSAAEPKAFQQTLVCGMCDGSVKVFPITTTAAELFEIRPRLTPEELKKRNPWISLFVRNNDSPELSEGEKTNEEEIPSEVHEEYRPGGKK